MYRVWEAVFVRIEWWEPARGGGFSRQQCTAVHRQPRVPAVSHAGSRGRPFCCPHRSVSWQFSSPTILLPDNSPPRQFSSQQFSSLTILLPTILLPDNSPPDNFPPRQFSSWQFSSPTILLPTIFLPDNSPPDNSPPDNFPPGQFSSCHFSHPGQLSSWTIILQSFSHPQTIPLPFFSTPAPTVLWLRTKVYYQGLGAKLL